MSFRVRNKTNQDLSVLESLVNKFYPYAQGKMKFSGPLQLSFVSDESNSANPLGKTAHYSPSEREIVIYTDGRHPKDILRSFSHELVHHTQNCRGEFDGEFETNEGYAQNNKHLREMESEAYLEGNLCFRDWENSDDAMGDTKMESALETKIREAVRSFLTEKTKTDAPDRAPSDTPQDRLKPLEEEEVTDEEVVEEEKRGYAFTVELVPRTGGMKKLTTLDSFKEADRFATEYREKNPDAVLNITQVTQEGKSVEEEGTLTEWKNRSINKLLMEKWCK